MSLYSADGELLIRWGGADGASLFLGDTVIRYAVLQANEKLDLNSPAAASLLQASDLVQSSLRFITGSLARVELGAQSWDELRAEASAEGRRLARAAWPDEEV